jgi:hypothetical protein
MTGDAGQTETAEPGACGLGCYKSAGGLTPQWGPEKIPDVSVSQLYGK